MPATDSQGSFLNRISIRRNQVVYDQEAEDLELFQKHVADRFSELLPPSSSSSSHPAGEDVVAGDSPETLLSIAWFRKLLDAFLCCEAEFKAVVIMGRDASHFGKPPLDRLIPEHLDRTVRALDICNAITHGIDLVRHWQKLAQIAVEALQQRPIAEGHVKRAKKALNTLLTSITIDDKENHHHSGKKGVESQTKDRETIGNLRSLSYCFAKSWSASKQIQAMSSNLAPPRGAEPTGLPVYAMSCVLVFVMWALVAAIPAQERAGLGGHFQLSKQLSWAQPMILLQERIGEEWKKKEKKGTSGLLEEMQRVEKLGQSLVEFSDGFTFPVEAERAAEVAAEVEEMAEICRRMEEGLVPLQLQVREVFQRIVRSRAEALDVLDPVNKMATPVPY